MSIRVEIYDENMKANKEKEENSSEKKAFRKEEEKKIERNESDFRSLLEYMEDGINPCFFCSSDNSNHPPGTDFLEHIPIHLDDFTDIFTVDPSLHRMPENRPIHPSQNISNEEKYSYKGTKLPDKRPKSIKISYPIESYTFSDDIDRKKSIEYPSGKLKKGQGDKYFLSRYRLKEPFCFFEERHRASIEKVEKIQILFPILNYNHIIYSLN